MSNRSITTWIAESDGKVHVKGWYFFFQVESMALQCRGPWKTANEAITKRNDFLNNLSSPVVTTSPLRLRSSQKGFPYQVCAQTSTYGALDE